MVLLSSRRSFFSRYRSKHSRRAAAAVPAEVGGRCELEQSDAFNTIHRMPNMHMTLWLGGTAMQRQNKDSRRAEEAAHFGQDCS